MNIVCYMLHCKYPFVPVCLSRLKDGGVFLAAIDDSNEHMLTVWDCLKGTKQTEIKVRLHPEALDERATRHLVLSQGEANQLQVPVKKGTSLLPYLTKKN